MNSGNSTSKQATSGEAQPQPSVSPTLMLSIAILVVSMAAIFIRKADAPPSSSLSYSLVASCVVLANTTPIWAALLTPLLGHQAIEGRVRKGIFFSFVGILVIEGPALFSGEGAWQGDMFALGAGLLAALYMLCGSRARVHFSIGSYLLVCYGAATAVLFIAVLATDTPLNGYSTESLIWVATRSPSRASR